MTGPARIAAGAAALVLCLNAAAGAHTELASSSPAGGAVLARAPAAVVLAFPTPPGRVRSVEVRADGRPAGGMPRAVGGDARRVAVPLRSAGPGRYRVSWQVYAADGDPVAGSFEFRVRAGPGAGHRARPDGRAVALVTVLGGRLVRVARALERAGGFR